MKKTFWACVTRKPKTLAGPFDTREEAVAAVWAAHPTAKEATSGFGAGGIYFDIQWTRNPAHDTWRKP